MLKNDLHLKSSLAVRIQQCACDFEIALPFFGISHYILSISLHLLEIKINLLQLKQGWLHSSRIEQHQENVDTEPTQYQTCYKWQERTNQANNTGEKAEQNRIERNGTEQCYKITSISK